MLVRLLLTSMLAVTLASAQRGGMGGMGGGGDSGGMGEMGGGMGSGMGGGGMRAQRQTRADMIVEKLKLNKEQKDDFQNILSAGREEAAPLRQNLDAARVQIATALIEGKSDEEVKKAVADYTAVAARITALEVKAYAKLYATLKPNQQAKAEQAFELMAGILTPSGGRPTGRGGNR